MQQDWKRKLKEEFNYEYEDEFEASETFFEDKYKMLKENIGIVSISGFLAMVANTGDIGLARYALDNGAEFRNQYALRNAIYNEKLEMIKFLVERGADIHHDNDSFIYDAAISNRELDTI